MDYKLDFLSEDDFEKLVNTICQNILGTGVISFRKGPDGGRDGKFTGIAEKYPSSKSPWSGKFIIQSKHTDNPIASCSDSPFKTAIKEKEIPKLIKLKDNEEIDNYLLFTNRKLTAGAEKEITDDIKTTVDISNVALIGKETINNYLSEYKNIVKSFGLNKYILPFDFTETDLKEIIIEFSEDLKQSKSDLQKEINKIKEDFKHIDKEEKNEKNKLSKEYYDNIIKESSLIYFTKIDDFLQNQNNKDLLDLYFDISAELNNMIMLKRDEFGAFEEIFVHIYQFVLDKSAGLKGKKRFIYIFLHHMYFNCHIGLK